MKRIATPGPCRAARPVTVPSRERLSTVGWAAAAPRRRRSATRIGSCRFPPRQAQIARRPGADSDAGRLLQLTRSGGRHDICVGRLVGGWGDSQDGVLGRL